MTKAEAFDLIQQALYDVNEFYAVSGDEVKQIKVPAEAWRLFSELVVPFDGPGVIFSTTREGEDAELSFK